MDQYFSLREDILLISYVCMKGIIEMQKVKILLNKKNHSEPMLRNPLPCVIALDLPRERHGYE